MTIKEDYLIEKRNALNEIRNNNLTLQELRFFSIYLAKINARDISSRVVRFALSDFQSIMELKQTKINYLSNVTDSLLSKIVRVPISDKVLESFQIFKECRIGKDDNDDWFVEIDAHDKALPLMFEFKEKYFTYELWNALQLKSSNQLRMYEILKQYENIGERIVSVKDLKELLGITSKEYPRYGDFKIHVLDVCRKALQEHTDIKFTYEPTGKRGRGGKILNLRFTILKNESYHDPLTLSDFIAQQEIAVNVANEGLMVKSGEGDHFTREIYPFLSEACENEFNKDEIQVVYNLLIKIIPPSMDPNRQLEMYNYLKRKYDELKWRAGRTEIKSRIGYLKKIIEVDLDIG